MKISDILAKKGSTVITISPDKSLKDAVRLMEDNNIGGLVVLDDEKLVGIITERDLIRYAAGDDPDFSKPVRGVMTRKVIVGMPQDDLHSVAHTMTEKRFRHLPVMDQGRLVGIVTIGDVLKAERDAYKGQVHTLETMITAEGEA